MSRLNGVTILIVEDEFPIAHDLSDALQRAGARVLGLVSSPREAIDMISRKGIDGALLDVNLGHDGHSIDVAVEMKRRNLPFIVVTGYDPANLPAVFRGVPCLTKPYPMVKLYDAIERAFRPSPLAA